MADIEDRVITVHVRDAKNNLVPSALITFFVNGVEAGKIDDSDGHATFQIHDRKAAVSVTVTYGNETQTAKLAQTADSYDFRLKDAMADDEDPKIPSWFPAAAFGVGVFFVLVVLLLVTLVSNPSPPTYKIYRIVISMGCAGFATALTGFIAIKMKFGAGILLMAGGSLAVFVIVYFWDPASNIVQTPSTDQSETRPRPDAHGSGAPSDGSASTLRSGPAPLGELHMGAADLAATYAGAVCMVSISNTIAYCNHADMAACQDAYAALSPGPFKQNHRCLERPKTFYCFAYRSVDRLGSGRILDLNACFTAANYCDMARTQYRAISGIQLVAASCDTLQPP